MVKKIIHALFIISVTLLATQAVFAASFIASVDRNEVAVGQGFTLQLSLSGASPNSAPDISALEKDFTIYGTSQSSQTSIVNNKVSSSVNWNVTLIPKKEGKLNIPSMSVSSDAGDLKSDPFQVSAEKPSATSKNGQGGTLFVDTKISKQTLYKNEPAMLLARLVTNKNIGDIVISDLIIPDVIIEKQGDFKMYEGALEGQSVKVIEARYLITPLKAGSVSIPAFVFQGKIQSSRRQTPHAGRLGGGFSNILGIMNTYEPFAVSGEEIKLEIKPPAAQIEPWLPAHMIKLSDDWDGLDNARVGDPLSRKLRIIAEGLSGAALPSLESQINPDESFKLYGDKPVTGESLSKDGKSVSGWREESYTLIPQKSGELTLPEVKLAWWDVTNNKVAYATAPSKTIDVKAGISRASASASEFVGQEKAAAEAGVPVQPSQTPMANQMTTMPAYFYSTIAALGVIVFIMVGMIIYLLRKLGKYEKQQGERGSAQGAKCPANEDRISMSALKKAATAKDLQVFLQDYANHHLGLPKNASLRRITDCLKTLNPHAEVQVLTDLDAMLYAGVDADIKGIKDGLAALLKTIKSPREVQEQKKFAKLNPS